MVDQPSREPPIPDYPFPDMASEPVAVKRARLQYQSRKRGMLENDLLLATFASKYLKTFSEKQLNLYDRLINGVSNDWDIFYWVVGQKPTPACFNDEVMDLLKTHAKNMNRELRIRQPDLN
jgi:succinate dehydrogenase assembly factor 2